MRSEIIVAGVIVATAIVGVRYLEHREERAPASAMLEAAQRQTEQPPTLAPAAYSTHTDWRDEVRIPAARDNQFYVEADVNRRAARFLVDTGASYVALRDSDARNAGVYTSWSDYTYPVRTANGETKAALVTLKEIEVGAIRVNDVKAFILPDDQLSINLLGMSFLSRLESVEARQGELLLRG
ncbi:MAG: TIGR02281 family clan AA aspartic protease [Pseudomonadota bacterium]